MNYECLRIKVTLKPKFALFKKNSKNFVIFRGKKSKEVRFLISSKVNVF